MPPHANAFHDEHESARARRLHGVVAPVIRQCGGHACLDSRWSVAEQFHDRSAETFTGSALPDDAPHDLCIRHPRAECEQGYEHPARPPQHHLIGG